MKMNKKKLLSLALVLVLIATLSFGSLAWFSDDDKVTNEFMVADSASTPDDIFSVDVWEYVDGDIINKNDNGYTYEDILPGGRYHKEPYVENTGSYDQYVRVKVTVSNADAWIAALGNGYDLGTMFEGHDETKWTRYEPGVYDGTNTYTMTFYLNDVLKPDQTACLFKAVKIPTELTQEDMVFIGGGFKLTILAQAVQTENLGIDTEAANAAYQAFQVVPMP